MFSCGRKKCEVAHWPSFTQSLDQPLVEFDERTAQGIFQTTLLEEPGATFQMYYWEYLGIPFI